MMKRKFLGGLLFGALTVSACSAPMTATTNTSSTPDYAKSGSNPVSVTRLDLGSAGNVLGERLATVFYPTSLGVSGKGDAPSAQICTKSFSYSQSETLPVSLRSVLPAAYDTHQSIPGTRVGCDGSGLGAVPHHFPVLLFSHGYGGERLYYSNLLAGIASWGFVVVSADYLERGLASQALKGTPPPTPSFDRSVMLSSLRAVVTAGADATSPLYRAVNPSKVAAAGHSMGGQTAFDALRAPGIATAIGWAPVGPVGTPSTKPTMIIGTTGDSAVTQAKVTATYQRFSAPKSLIEVVGLGHNSYTDICVGIRSGGGLINFAVANHFVSPRLAKLGINGCEKADASPVKLWPVVQYYTVFQLKNVFAGKASATPVPEPAPGFSPLTVHVTQQQ